MINKVLGVLYGMAIGDAMGMPPELWSRRRLIEEYGKITDFLDGHPDNDISYQYKRGHFTDDTSQAIVILDSLIETDFKPDVENIGRHIIKWARAENAFDNNILGPTSKITLEKLENGEDRSEFSDKALTNGAAMRIPPIGTLFSTYRAKDLCDYVAKISSVTHTSDITIAGACMVAMAVASAMEFGDRDKMLEDVASVEQYAMRLGAETVSPFMSDRIEYGAELAKAYKGQEDLFLDKLYRFMGAGVNTADSVPCAIAIAYYCNFDIKQCALMCANLGGDTDTIGAMATAICGGAKGIEGFEKEDIELINQANSVDFTPYAQAIITGREKV